MSAYTEGLRRFAEWLDAHPSFASPPEWETVITWGHLSTADEAVALVRALGRAEKDYDGSLLAIRHDFGGVKFRALFDRSEVCTRRVVGTEDVPETVVPAHTKEIVEWDCSPLLAASSDRRSLDDTDAAARDPHSVSEIPF